MQPTVPLQDLYSIPYLALLSLGPLICKMKIKYRCVKLQAHCLAQVLCSIKDNPKEEEEQEEERKGEREERETERNWEREKERKEWEERNTNEERHP